MGEEEEVFEITDFTTASEWERFIARLEEVFHDWKLSNILFSEHPTKIDLNEGKWTETSVLLKYADHEFVLTHHSFQSNIQTSTLTNELIESTSQRKNDEFSVTKNEDEVSKVWLEIVGGRNEAFQLFPPRAHCLCRWYGLKDFLILMTPSNADDVFSESRINMLISSLSIAASNTSCQIPVFVQAHSKWRRLFLGSHETGGFRTTFDMVHLRTIPPFCRHLTALLDIFRDKLACAAYSKPQINIAVRFTYVAHEFDSELWPQVQTDENVPVLTETNEMQKFMALPFGVTEDPITELQLSATWLSLSEEFIVENDSYSDFDPLNAHHWSIRLRLVESPQCLLSDHLQEFSKLHLRKESTQQILGKLQDNASQSNDVDAALALQRLTDPHLSKTLTHAVRRARSTFVIKSDEAPIPIKLLNEILLFIFPDARSDNSIHTESLNDNSIDNSEIKDILKQIKSGGNSSLVWRLAICCCIVNAQHGGVRAFSHLWQEFVMEMRYRWENNYLLPDVENGSPNLANCILYQKLQMLNCCIEKKKQRENNTSIAHQQSNDDQTDNNEKDDEDDDDEFFECIDETIAFSPTTNNSDSKEKILKTAYEGRLKPLEKYFLLSNGEQLYVPITQEAAPMTEDLLDEQAEIFSRLGTTAEGALLRARLQSASLLSDMEAFKAANPGCLMEDFVRWYSPRDWIVKSSLDNSSTTGELSQRMQLEGNMWIEIWQSALPTPVKKQKRLFDDTKEAEKVLHWLSSLSPCDVSMKLMPILLHAAIFKMIENNNDKLEMCQKYIHEASNLLVKVSRLPQTDTKLYEDILSRIRIIETYIGRNQSLCEKFFRNGISDLDSSNQIEVKKFISALLEVGGEVTINGGSQSIVGTILKKIFLSNCSKPLNSELVKADQAILPANSAPNEKQFLPERFPVPIGREYLLRSMASRPAPWSRPSPQRMFCTCTASEFRLAAAYTLDTMFQ